MYFMKKKNFNTAHTVCNTFGKHLDLGMKFKVHRIQKPTEIRIVNTVHTP